MDETKPAVRTAEKIAGVIAVVAAIVVLNGAWENQHTWQNLSWRFVTAAVLLGLAVVVETNAVGILQGRLRRSGDTSVPHFLRVGATLEHGDIAGGALAEGAVQGEQPGRASRLQGSHRDAD